MRLLKKIKSLKYLLLTLVLLPSIVLAQTGIIPDKPSPALPGGPSSSFTGEVNQIIQLFLGVVGLIAVAYLIYGGFRYITSAGNEETTENAKKIIQNSIIGLVVIILSYTIVVVIARALISSDI